MKAYFFEGKQGYKVRIADIPTDMMDQINDYRNRLLETLANNDDQIADLLLESQPVPAALIQSSIRKQCIARKFSPILVGSAFQNKGVQNLLDAILEYLPSPEQRKQFAIDSDSNELVELKHDTTLPFIALLFKIETIENICYNWIRVYQGTTQRGDVVTCPRTHEKIRIAKLCKMHSSHHEAVDSVGAGEVCALIGNLEVNSGDSLVSPKARQLTITSMHIPETVITVSVTVKDKSQMAKFVKLAKRFMKEDPTFIFQIDQESGEMQLSGMGELHLDIYRLRMLTEEGVTIQFGKPYVNYREYLTKKITFDATHKKQTGGSGQFAKIDGYVEPIPLESSKIFEFSDEVPRETLQRTFITAVKRSFEDAMEKGPLLGHKVRNMRVVLRGGAEHEVDSCDLSFRLVTQKAVNDIYSIKGAIGLLEPVMNVETSTPTEFYKDVVSDLLQKEANLKETDIHPETTTIRAEVPLANMFGFSSQIRQLTSGKGEFSMEYIRHDVMPEHRVERVLQEYGHARKKTK